MTSELKGISQTKNLKELGIESQKFRNFVEDYVCFMRLRHLAYQFLSKYIPEESHSSILT